MAMASGAPGGLAQIGYARGPDRVRCECDSELDDALHHQRSRWRARIVHGAGGGRQAARPNQAAKATRPRELAQEVAT